MNLLAKSKINCAALFLVIFASFSFSAEPAVEWTKTFIDHGNDWSIVARQTND